VGNWRWGLKSLAEMLQPEEAVGCIILHCLEFGALGVSSRCCCIGLHGSWNIRTSMQEHWGLWKKNLCIRSSNPQLQNLGYHPSSMGLSERLPVGMPASNSLHNAIPFYAEICHRFIMSLHLISSPIHRRRITRPFEFLSTHRTLPL